jgi:hypothetical protein
MRNIVPSIVYLTRQIRPTKPSSEVFAANIPLVGAYFSADRDRGTQIVEKTSRWLREVSTGHVAPGSAAIDQCLRLRFGRCAAGSVNEGS